nr:10105_t:CDS:2 [Entrophospora candida]
MEKIDQAQVKSFNVKNGHAMLGNTIGANANFSYTYIKNGLPEELSRLELNNKRMKFEKLFGKIEAKITKNDLAILKEVLDDQETLTHLRNSPYITAEKICSKVQEQLNQKKDKLPKYFKPPLKNNSNFLHFQHSTYIAKPKAFSISNFAIHLLNNSYKSTN